MSSHFDFCLDGITVTSSHADLPTFMCAYPCSAHAHRYHGLDPQVKYENKMNLIP
jgi:hypothetical protein